MNDVEVMGTIHDPPEGLKLSRVLEGGREGGREGGWVGRKAGVNMYVSFHSTLTWCYRLNLLFPLPPSLPPSLLSHFVDNKSEA